MVKTGIIGVGKNGEAFAKELYTRGHQVVLLNRTEKRAVGVMNDLVDAYPDFQENISVSSNYDDKVMDSDILFVCVKGNYDYSQFRSKNDLRLKGFERDGYLLNNVASHLKGYSGYLVVLSNPVDLVAKQIMLRAGISHHRIVAFGSNLDTLRGQNEFARRMNIKLDGEEDNRSRLSLMHVGEHGDRSFGLWSSAAYKGRPLAELGIDEQFMKEVDEYVRTRGVKVMLDKSDTVHATTRPLLDLVDWLTKDSERVLPISIFDDQKGIFYGQPVKRRKGAFYSCLPKNLSAYETEGLEGTIQKISSADDYANSMFVPKQTRRILYLDDASDVHITTRFQIKQMGMSDKGFSKFNNLEVETASTCREAKERLYARNYDIIITDQLLRGDPEFESGLEFVIREVCPYHSFTVPVMLSGQATEQDLKGAIGANFGGYIQKPLDMNDEKAWEILRKALAKNEENIIP
jgi:L-lactate dehydrogenase